MQRIAVIGGGIAGLTVALRRARAKAEVAVFEASAQVGGQLVSERKNGFVVEHGAEGFVARSEAVPALAAEVGIGDHVVDQLVQQSFHFDLGKLTALAPGEAGRILGFQVAPDELGRGIRSFHFGMGELAEAVAKALHQRAEFSLATQVTRVTPGVDGVSITLSNGDERPFDAAVIATTARNAATLLADGLGEPARALANATLSSSVTVSIAYRAERVRHPLDGTGLIVSKPETVAGLRAVTFVSSKLPSRAPEGYVLLRCFFRPSAEDLATLSDAQWQARAEHALGLVLPVSGAPEDAWVSRWKDALPVFDDAHRARVAALEAELAGRKIWLAGSAFHGSGIDAAIRSAERTARALANA